MVKTASKYYYLQSKATGDILQNNGIMSIWTSKQNAKAARPDDTWEAKRCPMLIRPMQEDK
jgi:hypothetical protein